MKVNLGPKVAYTSQAICLAIYFIAIRSLSPQKSSLKGTFHGQESYGGNLSLEYPPTPVG